MESNVVNPVTVNSLEVVDISNEDEGHYNDSREIHDSVTENPTNSQHGITRRRKLSAPVWSFATPKKNNTAKCNFCDYVSIISNKYGLFCETKGNN